MSIVFFDVESTLLDKQLKIPPSAINAIYELKNNHHLAFINTGGSRAEIPKFVLDVGFDGIIAANGTSIVIRGEKVLEKTISEEILNEVLPLFEQEKIDLWLGGPEYVYVADIKAQGFIGQVINYLNQNQNIVYSWNNTIPVANNATYRCTFPKQINVLLPTLRKYFSVKPHDELMGELFIPGYDKGTGIDVVQKYLNSKEETTYAIGDSDNDLPMFEKVTYGIAMANSSPKLLKNSNFVTTLSEKDGIEKALKHYKLIT